MTHQYTITGMTCKNCLAKVKSRLLSTGGIETVELQLESPQASISMQRHIATAELQAALSKAGNYTITEAGGGIHAEAAASWLSTYKPLILIFAYITGVTLLIQLAAGHADARVWMGQFMAAFFLVFSFFKLLDLKAFADSYAMYDLLAKNWRGWGYIYPFAELALGLAYLVFPGHALTSILTLMIMLLSIAGVLQSVLNKREIRCACLGAVFKLPMSIVTIIEDGLMIGMSIIMLLTMF